MSRSLRLVLYDSRHEQEFAKHRSDTFSAIEDCPLSPLCLVEFY
jgi:hypothetical protein